VSSVLSRLTQSSSIPWRRVGDDIMLAPPGRDEFDRLSGTAAVVWSILETPCSLEDLVSTLAELYSVPAQEIATDVEALVADLQERGAIRQISEPDD
jgi:hypothetical protein